MSYLRCGSEEIHACMGADAKPLTADHIPHMSEAFRKMQRSKYEFNKKAYLAGKITTCPQCDGTDGKHKMDCSIRWEIKNDTN